MVDPWGLADKDDIWYLMAGTDDGQRTFRIDRVIDAVMTDLDAEHPADFELSQAWQHVVEEVEQHHRSLVWATVLINAELLPAVNTQFGRHCEVDGPLDDGRIRVRANGRNDRRAPGWLGRARRGRETSAGPNRTRPDRCRTHPALPDLTNQRLTVPVADDRLAERLPSTSAAVTCNV